MKPPVPCKAIAAIVLLAVLSSGCVTPGFHGATPVAPVYGVGYFGPAGGPIGYSYGVWGPRYRVAPFHAPVRHRAFVSGRKGPRAFRAAPIGRPVPSIPRRRRARARRWPALAPPPVDWTYRFDARICADAPVVAPITASALAGSRPGLLVAIDESGKAKLVVLRN